MAIKFANNATATLASGISGSATTIVLAAGKGALFPTLGGGDYFYATLINGAAAMEIVKITDRTTDTLTATRAQEGTTGIVCVTGDIFECRPTMQGLYDLAAERLGATATASLATALATARAINGVNFDGSAAITVTAAAGTLTGATLAAGVTASSLTSAAGGSFGTAAFTAATAYATSTQGTTANNALPKSGGTMSGAIACGGNNVTGINNIGFNAEYNAGNTSTALSIVWSNGQNQRCTATANCTITVPNPTLVGHYQLRLIMDATGGRVVTWSGPSASRWGGSAAAPALLTTANGENIINFYWDGTTLTQTMFHIGAV